jgi:hypothetical protein
MSDPYCILVVREGETMSYNHENIVWQDRTGNWYIGFYERLPGDYNDPDYDSEWDDDFDYESFGWGSGPHASEKDATAAWNGANPGGHHILAWKNTKETREHVAKLTHMFKMLKDKTYRDKYLAKQAREARKRLEADVKERMPKLLGRKIRLVYQRGNQAPKSAEGFLREEGGVYSVGGVTIYNKNTDRVSSYVSHIYDITPARSYGYGYGRQGW